MNENKAPANYENVFLFSDREALFNYFDFEKITDFSFQNKKKKFLILIFRISNMKS